MSFGRGGGLTSMLIIAGHLTVDPSDRDRYVTECAEVVEHARRAPGCLDFALTADPLAPGRVNVYERWESDGELMAFRGSGPDAGTAARILGAEVRKYRISAVEQP
jgi:quinol monooxygenase YgiN